jgi:outer membrane protein
MKKLVICICCLASGLSADAQWTLRQCTEHAIAHNITVKQKDNVRRKQELQLSTSRNSWLPNLNATASENFNFGRAQTLDGTYSNRNTNNTAFSLGTTTPLFTGFRITNTIKMNRLNLEAVTQDLEKAKDDIRMEVAKAYVQVLYNMEIAEVAHRQIAIDSVQAERLMVMMQNGKASQADVSRQQATVAQSRLTATQADNQYQLSLLTLTQLLELPTPEGFSIVCPRADAPFMLPSGPDAIYAEAVTSKPEVQAELLRITAADRNIDIQKAALYPTLNFNAGLQTNYYKTNGVMADGFFSQMKNNFAQYLGVTLNVPIFNRFATRNSIRSARIDLDNSRLQLELVKKKLYKEIQQVYYNAVAAHSKYEKSLAARQSSQDAFELTQAKYENGKATITEFNEAKNNYLKTESDLVQARYESLYQTALLDFYRGKELSF